MSEQAKAEDSHFLPKLDYASGTTITMERGVIQFTFEWQAT
jgi:hypothetical protein